MSSSAANPKAAAPSPKPDAPKPDAKDDLKTLPVAEVEKKLGSSPDGLTQAEAQKRLTQYGPNEITEKKTNLFLKFLSYFWGPIPWMIEVAVILSGVVRHWPDFFIILLLLVSNAVVGFWEERQAGNAIAALKAKLAITARVKRDGKWVTPPARELVPGDAIQLRLGDIVPADARLLAGDPIQVDESALTGESLPATRKTGDAAFSGSIVRRGEIGALVYATGTKTYFGKTAQLVETAHTVSHFQKAVLKIGNYLIVLAVGLVAIIIAVAIFRGDPILTTLQFALVLTVAAIPVAMPTVLSVTMAVGARLLAKKQAIVSKLVAIEELAGVDMLCADKTGTLTQNKLTLGDPFCVGKIAADQIILDAALASRAEDKDTIDMAVLGGVKDASALKTYQILHYTPFDPVHKRTEATVKGPDGKEFIVTKGAPQVILALAADAAEVKSVVDKAVDEFAARGFRSLGVARADADGKWHFQGVLPLFDPPRDDAAATIATALKMGVKIKMVTGDALAIAQETAKKLGLGANILDAAGLGDGKRKESPEEISSIEKADGFAQVFPEQKFRIVDVLQKHGHIVGMTGDGVNDAPALKKADCGIAVSDATDAARAAAAIVLMTPGLSVIIDAIKESRRIFQRMNSYSMYRIAETIRVLLFMTLAILIFNFYPVTAVMIVMIALLNDGAILSIAYDNVHYKDAPEAWNMRLVLGISTVMGLFGVAAAFGLFFLGDRVFHLDHARVQTLMYLKLSVAGHLTIFLTRTRGPFWSIRPARILLIAVFGTQAIATLIAVYGLFMTPLGWGWAGFVWGYALIWFLVTDRVKLLAYRVLDHIKAETKTETKMPSETKDAPKSDAKAKPDAEPATKLDAKAEPDAKPTTKPDPAAAPAPTAKAEPDAKPDAVAEPAPAAEAKPDPKPAAKPDPAPASAPAAKAEPDAKPAPTPDAKAKPDAVAESAPTAQAEPDVKPAAKPDAAPAPAPAAKAEPDTKPAPKPEAAAEPATAAKAKPQPEPKPAPKPDAATKSAPAAEADAKPAPKADATRTPEAPAEPAPKVDVAGLFDMKLGDVLLAGLVKDPKSVAHLVSQAIENAEAPATDVVTKAEIKPELEAKAESEAKPEIAAKSRRLPKPENDTTGHIGDANIERTSMKIPTKDFRVREGEEVNLKKRPTRVDADYKSKKQYKKLLEEHIAQLSDQQQLLYADNRHAVLLIFQAMDAAGKDGAIRHVMSGVNPQGCQVFSFKHPSAAELEHDFLWRTTRDLPARGRIGIFNRSYYEEVLILRVHPELLRGEGLPDADEKKVWHHRYRSIVDLEKHLHESGMHIIKFFLHLSKDEQRKRFLARIDEPEKNWKFSINDIEERKFWDRYMAVYGDCLGATSTDHSPWYVVPADDKENARLIVSQIILDTLEDLKMNYPLVSAARRKELLAIRKRLAK